jgi:hypothetical protein
MDPGQRDGRRHRAEPDRVVPDPGKIPIGGPVVGDQLGLRGDVAEHKIMKCLLAKARDHLQLGASGLAAVDFDRAGEQHLANPAAAAGHDKGGVLGTERDHRFVGLDQALSGSRSELTMASRSLAHNVQPVRYEPTPSWSCSYSAEMPSECVAIRNEAGNQIVSGSLLVCLIVPAVTEVCRPQLAHS